MDYEKKYKEALEMAKDYYKANQKLGESDENEVLSDIFPELKESEDEKIRKEIIQYLKDYPNLPNGNYCRNDFFAWLEKQGELIDKLVKYREWLISKTEQWTERKNDKTNSNAGEHCCIGAANALISARAEFEEIFDYESWFEKQGEKKPIEEINGEDYGIDSLYHAQRILEKTLGEVEGYQSDDGILDHKAAITAVKKLYKQKPWSVEDMSKVQRICKYLDEAKKYYADITEVRECIDWLKSIKDKVQPQPKQEWSEEDEAHINSIIDYLLDYKLLVYEEDMNVANGVQKELDWLKSLQRIGG